MQKAHQVSCSGWLIWRMPVALSGRMISAQLTAPCAAGFVPYPYNEQMYHRIQTAMVVAGGVTGEGTILLMREDALTGWPLLPCWAWWLGHQTMEPVHAAAKAASVLSRCSHSSEGCVCQLLA